MRHQQLPEKFTRLGRGIDGREYIQCTRTGDVLVQTDTDHWSHFAGAQEWRERTAAQLYPELIHLQRSLKQVGAHEEIEAQRGELLAALELAERLGENLRQRIATLDASVATAGAAG